MNKIQVIKSGNDCNVTVNVLGSNGLPVDLKYIKSLAVKVALIGGSSYSVTPTISGNQMLLALTDTTELGNDGMYVLQVSGYDANGNAFSYEDQILEVAAGGLDVTTFERTIVIPGVTQPRKGAEVIAMDGEVIKLEDGMVVVGTGIDEVTFDYDVNAHFNAKAILSFAAGGSTHDATMPTGFKYIGPLASEAVSKSYLYTWECGVLTTVAEIKS